MKLESVQIELVGVCNATCGYCTWQSRKTGKTKMKTSMALRLLEECAEMGVETVRYHHTGESMLHLDLQDILEYGCSLIQTNILATNCSLLEGSRAEQMARLEGLDLVCSIHWVMGRHFVDRCVRNLKRYLDGGFSNRSVVVQLVCDQMAKPHLERFLAEFGGYARLDRVKVFLKQPVTWPSDLGVNVGFVPGEVPEGVVVDRQPTPRSIGFGCRMPEFFLSIQADGTAAPCCVGQEEWGLPSASEASLREIWSSPRMEQIREKWRTADDSVPCGFCKTRSDCLAS